MSYTPENQLAVPSEGQADWDASLGQVIQIVDRGHHTVARVGEAVNSGHVLWMSSGGFFYKFDPRSTAIVPHAVSLVAASSGDTIMPLLDGTVRSLYAANSIVPGLEYFVASGSPGVLISSLAGHPVTWSVGFGVAGGGLYFNPRKV